MEAKYFGQNKDASIQWDNMITLLEIADDLIEKTGINPTAAKEKVEKAEFVPAEQARLWVSCIDSKEYTTALYSISDCFWTMAESLKNMDSSKDSGKNYDLIIEAKDINTLAGFVNICDYSGFEKPISTIRVQKEYLAVPDRAWMEKALQETAAFLLQNDAVLQKQNSSIAFLCEFRLDSCVLNLLAKQQFCRQGTVL